MTDRDVLQALREAGLRLTAPRRKLIEVLGAAEQPLTADEVLERARAAGLAANLSTIYRNLSTFVGLGWLDALPGPNGERHFELHRDKESSAHVLCLDCGKLKPLTAEGFGPLTEALERYGFDPNTLRLSLSAHCNHVCEERQAEA